LRARAAIIIDPWVIMTRPADPTAKIALLRAAEEVFAGKGVDQAKVEDIAKAARVSKGAFYLHFESKEEALKQVVESFLGRMSAQLALPLELVPDTPDALVVFWLERDTEAFEFLWQSRAILGILQSCGGAYQYLVDAFRSECRGMMVSWLDLLKERGLVRKEVDAEVTATLMNGAYNDILMRLLSERSHPEADRWFSAAREIFVRGIGTPRLVAAIERQRQEGAPRDPRRAKNRRVNIGIESNAKSPKRNGHRHHP
jgi:AcrR family transcriptional regulator